MKHQALFSSKDKSKKLKCLLLQFLFSASRVNKEKVRNECSLVMPCHKKLWGIMLYPLKILSIHLSVH